MKKYVFATILLIFSVVSGCLMSCNSKDDPNNGIGDELDFAVDIADSEIPYVVIKTKQAIKNEPKVDATMKIFQSGNKLHDVQIGIEYRGSTSFRISDKKSYGIETRDAEGNDLTMSILGLPEEEDWILMGHVVNLTDRFIFDRTLMYHKLSYQLFSDMGHYASRCKWVELEINGEYLGVYVFMEKLKRDQNRIAISSLKEDAGAISGGYILKIDKTAGGDLGINQPLEYFLTNWQDDARYTEANSFRSDFDIYGNPLSIPPFGEPYHSQMFLETYFLYEYPKADEITAAQKTYIQDFIRSFEQSLLSDDFDSDERTYTDYIDLNSFADFFIINELCRNIDGYRLSTYLYKDKDGKLNMGPVWDFNIGFDTGDRIPWDDWVMHYNQYVFADAWMIPFWWPRLMEDPLFRSAVKERWSVLRTDVLSNNAIASIIDDAAEYLDQNGAISRNYLKWDRGIGVNYPESVGSLKNFMDYRANWMDQKIAEF